MEYVVMLDRSAGNAEVGEMWTETKVFPADAKLGDVHRWVQTQTAHYLKDAPLETFRANVRISVAQ